MTCLELLDAWHIERYLRNRFHALNATQSSIGGVKRERQEQTQHTKEAHDEDHCTVILSPHARPHVQPDGGHRQEHSPKVE